MLFPNAFESDPQVLLNMLMVQEVGDLCRCVPLHGVCVCVCVTSTLVAWSN